MNYSSVIRRYEKELLQSVIPFWEKNSIDHEHGGFFTFLDRKGKVFETDKYMWMQWRNVYMFSLLSQSQYSKKRWLEIALQGYEFLRKNGRDKSGNCYFALNKEGKPIVAPYSIYSETFAMMACATLYKATKKTHFRDEAILSMDNYLRRMNNPKGQWSKTLKDKQPHINLGLHMIRINMGTVMNECLSTQDYNGIIEESANLILNKFWHPEKKVLFENITSDYEFDLTTGEGRLINPGHGLEAMWFIMHHAETMGREDWIDKAALITRSLLQYGWDRKYGGITYMKDILNKPPTELFHDMKLWWVHNEAVLACLYAYRLTGERDFMNWFQKVDRWAWSKFRDRKYGEWFGYLNRQGTPSLLLKGGKWKAFFHLPRSLYFSIIQLRGIIAAERKRVTCR